MFGGIGFLINGNMACGVHRNDLIIRVGPGHYEEALTHPHVRVFDMTGRPMVGWVAVESQGCSSESGLRSWVEQGLTFTRSLPVK